MTNLGVRSAIEFAIVLERSSRRRSRSRSTEGANSSRGSLEPRIRRALEKSARTSWAQGLTLNDARLGGLARDDRRTIAEAMDSAIKAGDDGDLRPAHQLISVVDALKEIGHRLEAERLEPQLRTLVALLTGTEASRLDALCARMGLSGPSVTLQVAGEMAGITRERIRQLQMKLLKELKRSRFLYIPAADAAIALLQRSCPIRVQDAEPLLAGERVTLGRLDLSAFIGDWMVALGRRELEAVDYGGVRWIIRPELGTVEDQVARSGYFDSETENAIIDAIGRLCRSIGVCSLEWAAEEVGLAVDRENIRDVRRVAKASKTFSFLNHAWLWDPSVPAGRNRLDNTLRKVLSVTPSVSMDDAMQALDRVHRQRSLHRLPAAEAVALFAAAHPSFHHDDGRISTAIDLDVTAELAETERIFVEILSAVPGGVLDRNALRTACTERGMNGATFGQYTSFSPILSQPARNLWALRGRKVDSAVAQRVASSRRRRRRHAEATRTSDGNLKVSWTITGSEVSVFSIPSTERSGYVSRYYYARMEDGTYVGTIRVDDGGMSWGYGRFLRTASVATGDRLIATFDRNRSGVTLAVDRGSDRPWVGDLGNCFLHDESWALRLYVDDDLLSGGEWRMPLSLADAIGVSSGDVTIPWRRNPLRRVNVTRTDSACAGSSLATILDEIEAVSGDRLFLEIHTAWFDVQKRPHADPNGDPLQELLASAALPERLHGDAAWAALSRCLGGSSDGGRDEVEGRLRERGDHVGLGLLQRWRARTVAPPVTWPERWALFAELTEDKHNYAVRNGTGAVRVAVAVATRGAGIPSDALVDERGVVWADEARVHDIVGNLAGGEGIAITHADADWIEWARAEHHARWAAARSTGWVVRYFGPHWGCGDKTYDDLRDALIGVTVGADTSLTISDTVTGGYPSNGFAFRRASSQLVRNGLMLLRGKSGRLIAEFEDGTSREALTLVGLAS